MSTAVDTEHFRRRLEEERKRVVDAIENLHAENPGSLSDETDELSFQDNHLGRGLRHELDPLWVRLEVVRTTVDRELRLRLARLDRQVLAADHRHQVRRVPDHVGQEHRRDIDRHPVARRPQGPVASAVADRRQRVVTGEDLQRAEAALGQTLFGPQRDDVAIYYRGRESRSYASQGEQRLSAFLLVAALALAIQRCHGHRPVVLLDDVVSELDERNRKMIFDFLQAHTFQVFITDVEERLLYRHLEAFMSFQVSQVNGQAELRRTSAPQRGLCDVC